MSLRTATLIALIGATISVILGVLPAFLGEAWYRFFLFSGIWGHIITVSIRITYLIFFITLFVRQK